MEVFVLVAKKKNILLQFFSTLLLVTGVVTVVLSFIGLYMFLPFAIMEVAIGYVLSKRYIEYEYSYFDGDVRFAKIINKSKRKTLKGYSMEDVQIIAPIGDRSVQHYLNESGVKVRDMRSGNPKAKVYAMVVRAEGTQLVKFEPDEQYLDAICIKYRPKVIK